MKLVLVALKCDLREAAGDDDDENGAEKGGVHGGFIQYPEGLAVAQRIKVCQRHTWPHEEGCEENNGTNC